MRIGAFLCLVLFICGAGLGLIQLWVAPFSSALFFKLLITTAVLFGIVLAATLVFREYWEDKHLKDNGFID